MSFLSKIFAKEQKERQDDNIRQKEDPGKPEELPILRDYHDNINRINEELGNSTDVVIREFRLGIHKGALAYFDGLAESKVISDFVLESLIETSMENEISEPFTFLLEKAVSLGNIQVVRDWKKLYELFLSGDTIIFLDGFNKAISGSTRGGERGLLPNLPPNYLYEVQRIHLPNRSGPIPL